MVSIIKIGAIENQGSKVIVKHSRTKTMATTLIALLLVLMTVNGVIRASTNCRKSQETRPAQAKLLIQASIIFAFNS